MCIRDRLNCPSLSVLKQQTVACIDCPYKHNFNHCAVNNVFHIIKLDIKCVNDKIKFKCIYFILFFYMFFFTTTHVRTLPVWETSVNVSPRLSLSRTNTVGLSQSFHRSL